MTEDQRALLEAAEQSVAAAQVLLDNGFAGFAAARAYYAMFYVAEAFLEGEGESFSSHSGVIAAFGRDFAHQDRVPREFHRFILEAQELRHHGDYDAQATVTPEKATEQIGRARRFLDLGRQSMSPSG